jgi:hypothetical protein
MAAVVKKPVGHGITTPDRFYNYIPYWSHAGVLVRDEIIGSDRQASETHQE